MPRRTKTPPIIGETEVAAPPGRVSPLNRRAAARALVSLAERTRSTVPDDIRAVAQWSDDEVARRERERQATAATR